MSVDWVGLMVVLETLLQLKESETAYNSFLVSAFVANILSFLSVDVPL